MEVPGGVNQINPYGVLRPLESGPDIRVFLLESESRQNRSARVLTLIPKGFQQGAQSRRTIERLYNLRAQTEHPLLPEIRGIEFRGHQAGFVTPYTKDPTVFETAPAWAFARALEAAQDMLLLVAFLHDRQVHAGWLSPAKVFCRNERIATVNLVLPSEVLVGSQPSVRSLRYCAPEVLEGRRPDARSDAYSLGMLLYFLLTGCEPFSDSNPDSIRRKQVAVNPTPARIVRDGLPPFCQALIDGMIRKRPQDRLTVDQALHVLTDRTVRSQWQVPALSTPLIGRERESDRLGAIMDRFTRTPRPMVAVVSGPTGIGKSFLTGQMVAGARLRRLAVLRVAHRETDGAFEAFRRSPEPHPAENAPLGSEFRLEATPRSGLQIVGSILETARRSPLFIRATDLQWLDEGSLEVYRQILYADAPILLIGDARRDEPSRYWEELRSELREAGQLDEIPLEPLTDDAMHQILGSAIGPGWPEGWLAQIANICAGNPYHLKALLACLRDREQIRYGGLGWSGRHLSDSDWEPPRTVSDGLENRLDRLLRPERVILSYLALLDRPAELDLLSRITDRKPHRLLDDLRRLEARGFLEIDGSLACPVAGLTHRWLRAVLEKGLPASSRKRYHRRILHALTDPGVSQLQPGPEELARHAIAGGTRRDAERWTRLAVRQLKEDRLFRQASILFEHAFAQGCLPQVRWEEIRERIELLHLAGNHTMCEHLIRAQLAGKCPRHYLPYLWTMLARLLTIRGDLYEAARLLEQAHALCGDEPALHETAAELLRCLSRTGELTRARPLAAPLLKNGLRTRNPETWEKIADALSSFFSAAGRHAEAVHWSVRSIRCASRTGDSSVLAERCLRLGEAQLRRGYDRHASRLIHYAAALVPQPGNTPLSREASLYQAKLANREGRATAADRMLRERIRPSHRDAHPGLQARLLCELATSAMGRLKLHHAEQFLERSFRFAGTSDVDAQNDLALVAARLDLLVGRTERALASVRSLRAEKDPAWRLRAGRLLCRCFLAEGDPSGAQREMERIASEGLSCGPSVRFETRILQARIALASDLPERARVYLRSALEIARILDNRLLFARALCRSTHLWNRLGAPERARLTGCRALQALRGLDAPLLQARVLAGIAEAEKPLGRLQDAEQHFSAATELLQARCALFRAELRSAFSRAQIDPLLQRMARCLRKSRTSPPLRLVGLTRFATSVTGKRDPSWLARNLLKCLRDQLSISAGCLFWTGTEGGIGTAAASIGNPRFDPHRMIRTAMADQGPEIEPRIIQGTVTLVVPLDDSHGTAGWLYTEREGPLPEVEFDLLGTVKAIAQLALSQSSPRSRSSEAAGPVRLREGRVLAGSHPQVLQMIADVRRFSATESTVLISGESGTGKELVARAIHEFSNRRDGPFVAVNCASFAPDLIESQLFGHARGAFTGATDTRIGFFEAASGGTLFLDEISAMPLLLQPRLLRVLQEKEIIRLGETGKRSVDTRVVAATNCDLRMLCERGAFRPDLYHRLNVLRIDVPALRDRSSDIPILTRYFLDEIAGGAGLDIRIEPSALECLKQYAFPGNVRELRNLLENLAHTCSASCITASEVQARLDDSRPGEGSIEPHKGLERIVEAMAQGKAAFWSAVRKPFLERELAKRDVIHIVAMGLEACGGSYRRLVRYFGLADSEYKKFLNFLSHHGCKVDFRQFRRQNHGG